MIKITFEFILFFLGQRQMGSDFFLKSPLFTYIPLLFYVNFLLLFYLEISQPHNLLFLENEMKIVSLITTMTLKNKTKA